MRRFSPLFSSIKDDETFGSTLVLSTHGANHRQESGSRGVLTVLSGLDSGRVVALEAAAPVTLGRSGECTLSFADQGLSRVHAQISVQGQVFLLRDRGSRNGTFVNGQRIEQQVALRDSDRITLGAETNLRFSLVTPSEEEALRRTYEGATRDGLTGVFNRKQLEVRLASLVESARREGHLLSLAMLDVDHFKRVNDTHGHQAGDEVLRAVGALLRASARPGDLVARYGGEEFTVVSRADVLGLGLQIDALRALLKEQEIRSDGNVIRVTCSAGVASLDECADGSGASLLKLADERLYAAKKAGRDRVVGP